MEFQQLFIDPKQEGKDMPDYSDQYKYTAKFQAQASFVRPSEVSKEFEAKASLENLKNMLPEDQDFLKANDDLVFVACNLFTANLANKNGDCVLKQGSIDMAPGFVHRFADLEHNRYSIVGHAIDYGFHSYNDNKELSLEEVEALDEYEPFQVSVASVVYKLADPYFADFIQNESSDPKSPYYNSVSASFEVGFQEYWIAKGSPNMKNAELIKDPSMVEELSVYLTSNGGTGYDLEGNALYRVVINPKPLGFGFVQFPAGSVQGLVTANKNTTSEKEEETESSFITLENNEDILKLGYQDMKDILDIVKEKREESKGSITVLQNPKNKQNKNNLQKTQASCVNTKQVTKKVMTITSINDIQQDKMEEIQASDVRSFVSKCTEDAVQKANEEWEAKLAAETEAKTALETAKKELEDTVATHKSEVEQLKTQLAELQEKQAQAEKDHAFQSRMSILDEEFELEPDSRKIIAKAIQALETDEEFEQWKASFDVVANLSKKGQSAPEIQASESLASASSEVKTIGVSNNGSEDSELGSESFMKDLKESFNVKEGGVSIAKTLFR